ncbi:hypothetical protein TWF481_007680 [Arthrobotrys musiformis]|uniref:PA14 domain-containing protein n=1 Tax=Arthrobotrys musiformis TaxID=47236 RepID=A0AAV9WC66_9PEZI
MRFGRILPGFLLALATTGASASLILPDTGNELQERAYCPTKTLTRYTTKYKTTTKYLKTKTNTVFKTKTLPAKTSTKTATKTSTKTSTKTLPVVTSTATTTRTDTSTTTRTETSTTTRTDTSTTTRTETSTTTRTETSTTSLPGEVTTSTTVSTVIASPSAVPDTGCSNSGLEVAIYDSPFQETGGLPAENDFTHFKTVNPYNKTITSILGLVALVNGTSPHGFVVNDAISNLYALSYRGFFYAPKTGKYIFEILQADNLAGLWLREKAISGWSKSNANAVAYYVTGPTSASYEVYLTVGEYLPFRFVLENSGGPCGYVFQVTSSSGEYFVQNNVASPYFVQRPCDSGTGAQFPAFPAFGQEN